MSVLIAEDSVLVALASDFEPMRVTWSDVAQSNWAALQNALSSIGCPAYRDAFDFDVGYGAAA